MIFEWYNRNEKKFTFSFTFSFQLILCLLFLLWFIVKRHSQRFLRCGLVAWLGMAWFELVSYLGVGDQYESWIVRQLVGVWYGDRYWAGYVSKMLVGCGTRRWDCTLNLN